MRYSDKEAIRDNRRNKQECCICGKEFSGYGNNPYPIAKRGQCCDECNFDVVLPARLAGNSRRVAQKDSLTDVQTLINAERESVKKYEGLIQSLGDGLERSVYAELLADKQRAVEKLEQLIDSYRNFKIEK